MPNWSSIGREHVVAACRALDRDAPSARRAARTAFLIHDGKKYPAKHVLGAAYHLATGVELSPSDYQGGRPTLQVLEALGFETEHLTARRPRTRETGGEQPSVCGSTSKRSITRQRSDSVLQKERLHELLVAAYGEVTREGRFPWLVVPEDHTADATIRAIHRNLSGFRGHAGFANPGIALACDFVIPSERAILEYDERQHFTMPRAIALAAYPTGQAEGFDIEEWKQECLTVRARDNHPPYRDEQRAYYDAVRDLLSNQNGWRVIRIRHAEYDWASSDADRYLHTVFSNARPRRSLAVQGDDRPIRRVGVVSHDYRLRNALGHTDFSEHFHRINRTLDAAGCDTILYALYTWSHGSPVPRDYASVFDGMENVQTIILELGEPDAPQESLRTEIWDRKRTVPATVHQHFSTSGDRMGRKEAFMRDLSNRVHRDAALMLCGESNIISTVRDGEAISDPYDFLPWLDAMHIQVVLNPIHDYMVRYEMKTKRGHYSRRGRTVIAVWNKGKRRGSEAANPWTVHHDGVDRTYNVQELKLDTPGRADYRAGVVDINGLTAPEGQKPDA